MNGTLRTAPRWWGSREALIGLALIVAISAIIRVHLFFGYVGLDDAEYAQFAHRIARGAPDAVSYAGPAVFPLRVGIIHPTALLFRLFGPGEWTMVAYPFVLSLLGIALAYICAARLFGARAGLIAAALMGVLPWDIESATKLLPDMPAAVYAALGVTVILVVERGVHHRGWSRLAGGLAAGLAFGLSWLCKESIAYLVPFCAVWMVHSVRTRGWPMAVLWGGVAAGSLIVLLGEMLTYHLLAGDALFRFHEIERNYSQWPNGFFTEGSDFGWRAGEDYRRALLHRLFVSGPALILLSPTFLYLPLIGLFVAGWAAIRRDHRFFVPALWLCVLVLMYNFSSSSSQSYTPLALFHRYLFPIFFPSAVLAAGFLATSLSVSSRTGRARTPIVRWAAAGGACLLVLVGGSQLGRNLRNPSTWLSEVMMVSGQVSPESVLYSDALSLRALEFFSGYPAETAWRDLQAAPSADAIPTGSLVLIHPRGIEWLERNNGMWVAWPSAGPTDREAYLRDHYYRTPPTTWKLVFQRSDVLLYRVGSAGVATLTTTEDP